MSGIETLLATKVVGDLTLGTALTIAGGAMTAVSTIQQGQAAAAAGEAAEQQAAYRAAVLGREAEAKEIQAGQERASAQRNLIAERKKESLVASKVRNVAAASGGGALDPTVLDILGDVGTEGDYRALSALYGGDEAARSLEYGAMLNRAGAQGELYAGREARAAGRRARARSYTSAAGTILQTGASMFDKYGKGGPGDGFGDPADWYGAYNPKNPGYL